MAKSSRRSFPPAPTHARALLLHAHPRRDSFNQALGAAWAEGARASGLAVEVVHLADLDFELRLDDGDEGPLEPDLIDLQARIADAAHLAWVMEPVGAASRHFGEQQCRVAGFEPDVRFATADLQAQMRLIETGHAVGIMNDLTWAGAEVGFRALDLPGAPRREVFTAARTASESSPAIAAVRDALAAAVPAGL